MRKNLLKIGLSLLIMMLLPFKMLNAQTNVPYWKEGFTIGPGLCNLTTTTPTSNTSYYFQGSNSGTWWGKNIYSTTGTGCPTGNFHVRAKNISGVTDSAELVTPVVDWGIKELHFTRARASRFFTVWVTEDTSALTTNWTPVVFINGYSSTVLCNDTTILINSATAKRLKIVMRPGIDTDIDSVWLTNYNVILAPANPSVYTNTISEITFNSARMGGNVSNIGSSAVTQRGIVYGTSINPTLANTKVNMGSGLGAYSQIVTGLSASTLYHVRAFAINNTDTAYGADSSFTTLAIINEIPQTISGLQLWLDASDINNNGSNPSSGSSINTWKDRSGLGNDASVLSGQNAGVLNANQINGKSVVRFTRNTPFIGSVYNVPNVDIRAQNMPKLTIFTVYKQGAQSSPVADQAIWGCDNGAWDRFFFSSFPSYAGGGNDPNNGGVSQGSYANVVANAGIFNKTQLLTAVYDNQISSGSGVYFNGQNIATFTDITTLSDAQTSLRIGFDGDDNCYNGDIAEMMVYNRKLTNCEIVTINKYLGSKYGISFASVGIDTSGVTTFKNGDSVVLSSNVIAASYQWLKNGAAISGAISKNYTAKQSGNYQVVITNTCSDTSLIKQVVVIPTPIVRTTSISAITSNSATLSGNVIDSGTATVTERGIVYSTTINPTTANTKVTIGAGLGTFSKNVTGLTASTLYHVRAYAINSVGTSYGADSTFTTLAASGIVPTVRTNKPGPVGIYSAYLGGNVLDTGTASVTEIGVVYATTANPTTADNKEVFADRSVLVKFVGGLTPNTLYHVRYYAINSAGTGYGGDSTFTTLPIPIAAPTVKTLKALAININSANLGGNVSDTGSASVTERGIVYATTANPTMANNKVTIGTGKGQFYKIVTGLSASTLYHFRAYAINEVDTSYGGDSTFTTTSTPAISPSVITSGASLIGVTNATLGGSVTDSGTAKVTERGIVYSTTPNPTITNNKVVMGSGLGTFSQNVTGLNPSTLYHVRAYAINSVGTSYGADSTFVTAIQVVSAPTVLTNSAKLIGTTNATLGGNVIDSGTATVIDRGVVFSTTANPTTSNAKVVIGAGLGSYSQNITLLSPNTTYHFRAYAINSVGTSYGADSSFTTLAESATIEKIVNAFSPNGDGLNDTWEIENAAELKDHLIVVYNIFGQEVFSQTGYDVPWDGKVDGNPVPSAEYYYLIKGPKVNKRGALLIKNN